MTRKIDYLAGMDDRNAKNVSTLSLRSTQEFERISVDIAVQETLKIPTVPRPEPTRYGDWEQSGRCIDF
jgi:hypothetical protein